jgi:uncharacterized membrane protein HdeD (DUF308 family)
MEFLREHRTAFIVESILLVILGFIAIALPFYATLSIELTVGWILVFAGLVMLYKSIKTIKDPGGVISLFGAIINIVIGALMLIYPLTGILTLTLLVGIFFALEGLAKIAISFELKPAQNWGWILFSGILALIMSGIILWGWPATSVWVIGLLVGINLVFFGISLFSLVVNLPKKTT